MLKFGHVILHIVQRLHFPFRKPTPDSSDLTKWTPTKGFPLDYYRIGHAHDAKKPLLGMETGLFDNRAEFWRDLGAHLPARHGTKDEL